MDGRFKDISWKLSDGTSIATWEKVQVAVLMDIRDELKRLNGVLNCPNFLEIPAILRRISRNTAKPKAEKGSLSGR